MGMETSVDEVLKSRLDGIMKWLEENQSECRTEQRHLDEGTQERAYWHYGYAVAIRDVLALLGDASTPKH